MLPTEQKQIGFLIHRPFQYFVFKNIYQSLVNRGVKATFIIDPTSSFPNRPDEETMIRIKKLLQDKNVNFVEFSFDHFFSEQFTDNFLSAFSVLVSVWSWGLVSRVKEQRTVCVMYGAGKELTMFGFWKRHFDLCLTYGKQQHKFLSQLTTSVIVGNPKFDDWFRGDFDQNLLKELSGRIQSRKKTILYLPTHSDLSSIKDLAGPLKDISDEYNVLVKLHYYHRTDNPELVRMMEGGPLVLFDDSADLITLLSIADVVISDNSSAIFDAMFADKPILVTDFHSPSYLDGEHRSLRHYKRGFASALTYSGSIEQRIKKDGSVFTITKPTDLRNMLPLVISDPPKIKEKRRKLARWILQFHDQYSGERAADAIIQLRDTKELPEKPFLAHAIDFFEQDITQRMSLLTSYRPIHSSQGELVDKSELCLFVLNKNCNAQDVERTIFSFLPLGISDIYIYPELFSRNTFQGTATIHMLNGTFAEALCNIVSRYRRVIVVYGGCILEVATTQGDIIMDQVLRQDLRLASGYVYKKGTDKDGWEAINQLEFMIASGYLYHADAVRGGYVHEVRSKFWNTPADEPRFFVFDTYDMIKHTIPIEYAQNEYHLMLLLRNYLISKNIPTILLPIGIAETLRRDHLYLDKLVAKVLFEAKQKKKLIKILRPRIKLVGATLAFPYKHIRYFPLALFALWKTILWWGFARLTHTWVMIQKIVNEENRSG